jgi:hypothetical protein
MMVLDAVSSAKAQFFMVTSASAFAQSDMIDWSTLGPNLTPVSNPTTLTTQGGSAVTVSEVSGNPDLLFQSQVLFQALSWDGNFAPGAPVLWTGGANGPITLTFAQPVSGVGAQINAETFGAFTAEISLFDSSNELLASYVESGVTANTDDNTAIFIGGQQISGAPEIAYAVFSVPTSTGSPDNFAIGDVAILVPEPSAWSLFIGGLALMLVWHRALRLARAGRSR